MTDGELRFSAGDLLVDRDDDPDERGTVVVLRYIRDAAESPVVAKSHVFAPETTVYDVNEDYPADDPVVEVAFEGWLDSTVPAWRGLLADARATDETTFYGLLSEFVSEWGIPARTYSYPESRLVPRRYCRDHDMRGERVEAFPPAGEPGGWACPVENCGYGTLPFNDEPLDALAERDDENDADTDERA